MGTFRVPYGHTWNTWIVSYLPGVSSDEHEAKLRSQVEMSIFNGAPSWVKTLHGRLAAKRSSSCLREVVGVRFNVSSRSDYQAVSIDYRSITVCYKRYCRQSLLGCGVVTAHML